MILEKYSNVLYFMKNSEIEAPSSDSGGVVGWLPFVSLFVLRYQ
jgi:hypothetical protein